MGYNTSIAVWGVLFLCYRLTSPPLQWWWWGHRLHCVHILLLTRKPVVAQVKGADLHVLEEVWDSARQMVVTHEQPVEDDPCMHKDTCIIREKGGIRLIMRMESRRLNLIDQEPKHGKFQQLLYLIYC